MTPQEELEAEALKIDCFHIFDLDVLSILIGVVNAVRLLLVYDFKKDLRRAKAKAQGFMNPNFVRRNLEFCEIFNPAKKSNSLVLNSTV